MATTKNKLPEWLQNQIDIINGATLELHWWNFGKKTLDHKGDVREYLKRRNIKIIQRIDNNKLVGDIPKITYHVTVRVSSMEVKLKCYDYETAVVKGIHTFLTLMNDKSQFWFMGRPYSVNYHR